MKTHKMFNLAIVFVFVVSLLGIPVQVSAQEPAFPRMEIDIYGNHIFASDWIVGTNVTVSFDIPGSDEEWDYSKTVTVPEGWGAWCQFQIDIDPAIFHIASGQVVRITDGTTTRQATIPNFSVTSEDPTADTVSGIAPAGSIVNLLTSSGGSIYQRNPIADSEGQWFADFAHPGAGRDEQGIFDVIPGDGRLFGFFWISQPINDFVDIKFMWDFGPYFHIFPEDERIETYVWPIGANLTVAIDNPATAQNPDVTRSQENLDWQTDFEELGTILPGFIVSITDGLVTKTHTVTDLALTYVDSQTDTVTGTAEPGSIVDLRTCCGNNGWVNRHAHAGDNHNWIADFSVPGEGNDELDSFDIRPGDEGDVQQADIDGDTTALRWRAPNPPTFMLNVNNDSSWRGLDAWNWPLGSQVTLSVTDPNATQNPVYTEVQTMMQGNGRTHAMYMQNYDLEGHFEGHPGFIITLSDGIQTKSMIVPLVAITGYDVLNDTISGIANPFAKVLVVGPCSLEDCSNPTEIEVEANSNGNWLASFVDIQPGDGYEAQIYDEDSDHTVLRDWSARLELKGFYQPVDMNGIYNVVKGGSTVPFKFEIFAGSTELIDITSIKSFSYAQTACGANVLTDQIETVVTESSGLRYDSTAGQFIYNWKTPSNAGKCYRVTMTTMDGSSLVAYFKLK